jgi:protease-4
MNGFLKSAAAASITVGLLVASSGTALAQEGRSGKHVHAVAAGAGGATAKGERARVATLELKHRPLEQPGPFDWLAGPEGDPTLRDLIMAIRDVAEDESVDELLIRLKDAELGQTQTEELGAAIKFVRDSGKKVRVFADAYGPSELLLGSYADEIVAQAGGPVSLPGMHMEEMFLADTLAWIGVKADFVQIGDYKGASEQMARSGPSKEWDQNINQLLDSIYGNMRGTLKSGRGIDDKQLDAAMQVSWMAEAEDATKAKLIDAAIDLPGLTGHMEAAAGRKIEWLPPIRPTSAGDSVDMSNPFAIFSLMSKKPSHAPRGPTIAILHIDGPIIDGESSTGGLFGGEGNVGSRTIRNAVEEILEQDLIKGVIVRINSPGGSATASEIIWKGLRRIAEKKPVWASVGSMAASGGYYCAVAADRIYVNPSSIVGSIGVVGGRMSLDGLYQKVHLNVVSRSRGPAAGMFRSTSPWTDQEREMVRAKMKQTYDQFTSRVTAGRKGIDLAKTAEGRLFTGDKAVGLNMADKVGGIDACIADLASELKLDVYDVMDYPGPKSLQEIIEDAFGGMSAGAPRVPGSAIADAGAVLREVLGDRAYEQIRANLVGMMQLRNEPVILMGPSALIFK